MAPETDPVEALPVAQGIRARGYEPRCRGFESLLTHKKPIIPEMSLEIQAIADDNSFYDAYIPRPKYKKLPIKIPQ